MKIKNDNGNLSSTWYTKPTDTGLILNYHALAPRRYKKAVVAGFVYRIHRSCSTWRAFRESLEKAKVILEKNQYPPTFYEPIIKESLQNIINKSTEHRSDVRNDDVLKEGGKLMIFIQYRGKCIEEYAKGLHKLKAPCTVIMTLRKLKTVIPSLKPPIDKCVRSRIVYKFHCSRCQACYVGATTRHMKTQLGEHLKPSAVVGKHLKSCKARKIILEEIEILAACSRSEDFLFTLEALYINEIGPKINTKDEYKRRELTKNKK